MTKNAKKFDQKYCWDMILFQLLGHTLAIIGLYYLLSGRCKILTYLWVIFTFLLGSHGITTSAHRLFAHRSYKVTTGLKIFMIFCQQLAGVLSVFYWCRVHRTHHKFAETDKDPTDINRGLFYAYIKWSWMTHTPEVQEEMDKIDMSDLLSDDMLQFQNKYYKPLYVLITLLLPTIVPYYAWNESLTIAFCVNVTRLILNFTQQNIGNGLLHYNGLKPYDKNITAAESKWWIICTLGEGYHNYHHAFPYDYRAAESSKLSDWNFGAFFIDTCAKFGLVYDQKTASKEMIEKRVIRTGDGSHWMMRDWRFNDDNNINNNNNNIKN